MAINHLAPPTGNMADNVVGFARALRKAGLPVGPGAVIDAMNALQAIEIGHRGDVFATLQAIFVKRHEHALIFKQAFDLFFRATEEWKHMLDSVPLPDHARKNRRRPRAGCRRRFHSPRCMSSRRPGSRSCVCRCPTRRSCRRRILRR